MKSIGIFGGSFNPVHNGHLILANYIRRKYALDEVWFMVSPLNPLKENPDELLPDARRMAMVALAVNPAEGLEPCDIELSLPRPSYTINTLEFLDKEYSEAEFSLIIGADSFLNFNQWLDPERIIELTKEIIVYPRAGYELPEEAPVGFVFASDAPIIEICSTEIRKDIKNCYDVQFLMPDSVISYIKKHNLYR